MITLPHIPARNAALEGGEEVTPDLVAGGGARVEEGGHGDLIERESKVEMWSTQCHKEKRVVR